MARIIPTVVLAASVALAACAGGGETPAVEIPPASAGPTLIPIPEATPRPSPAEADMPAILAPATGDLDAITARGYLRVLVTPSRTHFAVVDGLHRGAAVDAGIALEAFLNARRAPAQPPIEVVFVPAPENALVSELVAGRGDVAANILFTFERDDQIAFAAPARSGIRELVVTGPGVPPMVSLEDVAGRSIHARKSSDHYASLVRLNEQLARIDKPGCTIVVADESLTDEDLVALVNDGSIPATLVNDYILDVWSGVFASVSVNRDVAVSQDGVQAWAVRKESPALLALVTEFMTTHEMRVRPQVP